MGDGVDCPCSDDEHPKVQEGGDIEFVMGHNLGDIGDNAEVLAAAITGIEAFFKLSGGAKASCNVGVHDLEAEGVDGEHDWLSPRISFSHDLVMGGIKDACTSSGSHKASSEKTTLQGAGAGGGEADEYSSDFEFLNDGIGHGGFTHDADELFSGGKLLPLDTQQEMDNTPSCTGHGSKQDCHHKQDRKAIARHLSFDLPKASLSSFTCELGPIVSLSVDNSPCSSPPWIKPTPTTAVMESTAPSSSQKGSSKHSFKIKDLFRPKRANSTVTQLTRDNSTTSMCRIPMPPRSFWPFSRSNSAGECKTTTQPPPTLPPRSNSAGGSSTGRVSPVCESTCQACNAEAYLPNSAHYQADMAMDSTCGKSTFGNLPDAQNDGASCSNEGGASAKEGDAGGGESTNLKVNTLVGARRRRHVSTAPNFLKGSPGRRGRFNSSSSLAKVNAGKVMLKNLERCSVERKLLYRESSTRRAVYYPVAVRVSPVLNLALYRGGKSPTRGMFSLSSFFSSKKEKDREKPMEAVMNNWRVGA